MTRLGSINEPSPLMAAAMQRQVDELRDRIDRVVAHDPADVEAALRTLAYAQPDLVTEALDEAGAPS
jgi:hypothetical protein